MSIDNVVILQTDNQNADRVMMCKIRDFLAMKGIKHRDVNQYNILVGEKEDNLEILKHSSFDQAVEGSDYKMFLLNFEETFNTDLKDEML